MTTENLDWITPPDCDLRDFPFMPLDVVRLRDSDLAGLSDATFRIAVLAWCASWHQVPAGSLPSDDTQLARLLGYGRDVKSWKRDRAKHGLHGFCAAQDGRLYHPVVCEKAREAWDMRNRQRRNARVGASKRWNNNDPGHATGNAPGNASEHAGAMPVGKPKNAKDRTGQDSKDRTGQYTREALPQHEEVGLGWLEEACEAAGMPRGAAVNEIGRGQSWLTLGLRPEQIVETIRLTAMQRNLQPGKVSSLAYFDKPVRESAAEAKANAVTPEGMQASRDGYVSLFKHGRPWNRALGPAPGEPGCLCSPDVLRKHGFEVQP